MTFHAGYYHSLRPFVVLLGLTVILLAAAPAIAQESARPVFPPTEGTTWGKSEALGDGEIRTFVTLDEAGNPSLVGVYFGESALSGLPETPSDGESDIKDADGNVIIPCCGHEVLVEFPEAISATPLDHFVMNWNPVGHPPAGVYESPHFDLHFYTISVEDRDAIAMATADTLCMVPNPPDVGGEHPVAVSCEVFEQATMPLPDDQVPPGFISLGAVEPRMGDHLGSFEASELHGEPFTYTWIYGAYGGRLIFYEPMVTAAFLEEKHEEVCTEIAMPEAMPEPGYYPSEYCIRYLPGEEDGAGAYVVSLESFIEY